MTEVDDFFLLIRRIVYKSMSNICIFLTFKLEVGVVISIWPKDAY